MPSMGAGSLTLTGGAVTFIPPVVEFGSASLALVGGTGPTFKIGIDPAAEAVTIPTLDYLDGSQPIVDAQGRPTPQFQFLIQQHVDKIIAAFTAVDERDTDQDSILARLTAAETLARVANDNATAAQATATAAQTTATAAQATAEQANEAALNTFGTLDPNLQAYYESFLIE